MKSSALLCIALLAAASDTLGDRIAIYGLDDTLELIQRDASFPFPYTRSLPPRTSLQMEDLRFGPLTVLVRHPSDPSHLVAHHLPSGLGDGEKLRHLVQTFKPVSDEVALVAYPWELPILVPDSQVTGLSDLVRHSEEPYLIIRHRDEVRTDLLKELFFLELLNDEDRVSRDHYNLSLFPVRYYNPYVQEVHRPFLAKKYRDAFLYNVDQNPCHPDSRYVSHEGLSYYPFVKGDEYDDDYLRYDIYTYPNIKPVAIVPGDEYAIYYPATYPIHSTVPVVAAPAPPSVAASVTRVSPLF